MHNSKLQIPQRVLLLGQFTNRWNQLWCPHIKKCCIFLIYCRNKYRLWGRLLLTALWHYLEFLPGIYHVTNARAWGIYYYYKDWPTRFQEISLYFYEVTQTRMPPYCFECTIALIKADNFTTKIQSSNSKQHFRFSAGGYRMFYYQLILCAQTGFRSLRTSGANFTKGLKSRFRLKSKTLVLNFVQKLLSLWS